MTRPTKALFGQLGDQVRQVKDQVGHGQGKELDNFVKIFYWGDKKWSTSESSSNRESSDRLDKLQNQKMKDDNGEVGCEGDEAGGEGDDEGVTRLLTPASKIKL